MVENWKGSLIVFAVLVALVVWGGWLPVAALVATMLLVAGTFTIWTSGLHPALHAAVILVCLLIRPA